MSLLLYSMPEAGGILWILKFWAHWLEFEEDLLNLFLLGVFIFWLSFKASFSSISADCSYKIQTVDLIPDLTLICRFT